ncbi:hypothetical protein [uncultured Secundilactobacillus sp.]|uniref:hypothetical protein n=1 Tax=uncultured Secundilactobacillus sp. TaxID=2813935 RepID=UPI0025872846|nr:hypothetical protein [uncultured Secundilactobacillus sp.]
MEQHKRFDDLVTMVTALNPDNDSPTVIGYVVKKVALDVANYTHIPVQELPEELDPTIVALCQQTIETHGYLTPQSDQTKGVASLSEGDTSVTFKSPAQVYAELAVVNTITDSYIATLNSFRKVKW